MVANVPCMARADSKFAAYLGGVAAFCESGANRTYRCIIKPGVAIGLALAIPNVANAAGVVMGDCAPLKIVDGIVLRVAVNMVDDGMVFRVFDECSGNEAMHQHGLFPPAAIGQVNAQMASRFHLELTQKNSAPLRCSAIIPDANSLPDAEHFSSVADGVPSLKPSNVFPVFHSIPLIWNTPMLPHKLGVAS